MSITATTRPYRRPVSPTSMCRIALIAMLLIPLNASALIDLKPGDDAPKLTTKSIDRKSIQVPDPRGQIQILFFGNSAQDSLIKTANQINAALSDPRVDDLETQWILVLSADSKPQNVTIALHEDTLKHLTIVRDRDHHAFEAYKVVAMPSVAVIDSEGKIVRTHAGPNPRAQQRILEDLLVAADRLDAVVPENANDDSKQDPERERAARLTHLGDQLRLKGMLDNAESAYTKALAIHPQDHDANIGIAEILLDTDRATESIPRFQAALAADPDSAQAFLGLCAAHIQKESPDLDAIEPRIEAFIETHPTNPRAHFVMGMAQERRADYENASLSFKRAAELFLEQSQCTGDPP